MTTGIFTAYLRADCAVVGAAFVVLVSACISVGIDTYTDRQVAVAAAAPAPAIQLPAELAAAGYAQDEYCLTEAMYHEARGEGIEGMKAVAEVVLHRVRSRLYPNTICGVVHEGIDRGDYLCQFSYACDGSLKRPIQPAVWQETNVLASRIMAGVTSVGSETRDAIAYHAVTVQPFWAANMLRTRQIGNHIFYRFMPLRRASLKTKNADGPRGGVLLPNGEILTYSSLYSEPSDKIETGVETYGAVGDGT